MNEDSDNQVFRYDTKKEYEDEIKKLINSRNITPKKKNKKKDIEFLDEEYESLVDEYLRFCTSNVNG